MPENPGSPSSPFRPQGSKGNSTLARAWRGLGVARAWRGHVLFPQAAVLVRRRQACGSAAVGANAAAAADVQNDFRLRRGPNVRTTTTSVRGLTEFGSFFRVPPARVRCRRRAMGLRPAGSGRTLVVVVRTFGPRHSRKSFLADVRPVGNYALNVPGTIGVQGTMLGGTPGGRGVVPAPRPRHARATPASLSCSSRRSAPAGLLNNVASGGAAAAAGGTAAAATSGGGGGAGRGRSAARASMEWSVCCPRHIAHRGQPPAFQSQSRLPPPSRGPPTSYLADLVSVTAGAGVRAENQTPAGFTDGTVDQSITAELRLHTIRTPKKNCLNRVPRQSLKSSPTSAPRAAWGPGARCEVCVCPPGPAPENPEFPNPPPPRTELPIQHTTAVHRERCGVAQRGRLDLDPRGAGIPPRAPVEGGGGA
eukprot:gene21263-biopygen4136